MAFKRRHPEDIIETTASVVALSISTAGRLDTLLTPREAARVYLEFLRESARIVTENGGAIGEMSGSSMLSYWDTDNADGAVAACRCALQQQAAISAMRVDDAEGVLHAQIGINTGPVMLINIGLKDFGGSMLFGAHVNLAWRLSSANKQYFTDIIASERTVGEARDRVHVRELDDIRIVGMNRPAIIYELEDISDRQ